jgi:methyltransferase (TIGR00027 family)
VSQAGRLIENLSDTAHWVAVYRARETDRPDAVFRDPLARRLAGQRGERIAAAMTPGTGQTWPFVARTYLIDQFITEQIQQGVDTVVNLAAGLDARPYRMPLPATLCWIEVDLPDLINYKEELLRDEKPVCALERVRLDLADVTARRDLFKHLGQNANNVLIVAEGLLIYLTPEDVGTLAQDLAMPPSFRRWVVEVVSPGLLRMLQKMYASHLSEAGAAMKFGPEEGPEFFTRYRWKPIDVRSMLKTAARLKRVSWWLRLLACLPDSKGRQGSRPWSGICLLVKE